MIKIASFNVENLYARPKAFSYPAIGVREVITKDINDVNTSGVCRKGPAGGHKTEPDKWANYLNLRP